MTRPGNVDGSADAGRADVAETALIDAARRGDAAAFDRLVERHMRRAYAVAYRLLDHRQDAEDLVQDAFMAALAKLDTFERGRRFGPWLMRIVVNRGLNVRKARALRRTEPIPPTIPLNGASPLESAERSELRSRIERAVAELPEKQRLIVQLFELDGFTSPEIAGMLDMAEGTVRWHVHQARQSLRAALEPHSGRTS